MPNRIFVSYARNDLQGPELQWFFEELEKELSVELGTKDAVLFRDLAAIEIGADWADSLAEALKTSAIMVAICSQSYMNSEYCGKEFGVFVDRFEEAKKQAGAQAGSLRAIFPIIWMKPDNGIPAAISAFQYHTTRLPSSYAEHGLRQLFRLKQH